MRPSEAVEIAVVRDLFACSPGGTELREAGSALAFRAAFAPEARELNRILGLEQLEQLDELEPLYEEARFWVSPDPAVGLDRALLERGFTADLPWQKFEREPAPVSAETDLRIAETDERFGGVFAAAYGMPAAFGGWMGLLPGRTGWHCLAAYDGGEPVATGALFASAGTGWLGMTGTLQSHRGRGAQSALLAARITRAHELGLDLVTTETGVPGEEGPGPSYRNILRAGLREAYVRPNYRSP
jgi:GNAT superfamily N-acetyltransferase